MPGEIGEEPHWRQVSRALSHGRGHSAFR